MFINPLLPMGIRITHPRLKCTAFGENARRETGNRAISGRREQTKFTGRSRKPREPCGFTGWRHRRRNRVVEIMAVDAVCSEPVSAEFPVKQVKNREFSQNHPLIRPVGRSNRLGSQVFSVEFPKRRNRELFQRNREFHPRNRELSGGSGNRRTGPPQPQIGGPKQPRFDTPTRRNLSPLSALLRPEYLQLPTYPVLSWTSEFDPTRTLGQFGRRLESRARNYRELALQVSV